MEEDKTLKDEIRELKETIEETSQKKEKKFKLPWKSRISNRKLRENYVTVMTINENRGVDFKRVQIKDQAVMVDGIPRLATGDEILIYKKKPLMIVPSWSVNPFSPKENYEQSVKENMNTNGYRILLSIMKSELISTKKKLGLGLTIGGIVLLGIIAYALFKGV